MARQEKKKDVVIVGLGWTGSIAGIELAQEGLEIVALERGPDQNTVPDFQYPQQIDELKYGIRLKMMQQPRQNTVTVRRNTGESALPYRVIGSWQAGNGVGGAGAHWNAALFRPMEQEFKLRSYVADRWGTGIIPEDMNLTDYPISHADLEPFMDQFERVAGVSGKAGNLNGQIIEGGNPFEAPRSREYPMPPLPITWNGQKFKDAVQSLGLHPFTRPGGIASTSYVNPYGMQMGPCNFCGFCERYGCYQYSKASPQTAILDALKRYDNFSYRTMSEVLRVELAEDGKTATGVTYFDHVAQEEVFQPADIVILAGFQLNNVQLMLHSGIGEPYDPRTGAGVTGKNYAYQMNGASILYFEDETFNPFVGAGSNGVSFDDFGVNQIDFGAEGFIGGSFITSGQSHGQPIRGIALPTGTPSWGKEWKEGVSRWYGRSMVIDAHGSHMAYRGNYLDLDPTYKDRFGRPLMRMTFNWQDNDLRMLQFMKSKVKAIADVLKPDSLQEYYKDVGAMYDIRPYQTTHNTGGHIMSENPAEGVVNRYSQVWGQHNVFALGAGNFVQNTQYNPTGLLGGLAYHTTHAIRTQYLSNPRPLV